MMDSNRLHAFARWRLAFGHRVLWRVFLAVALALVFAVLVIRGDAEDPRKNYAESHKALLALAPPPVPDSENAALDYRKAFAAFVGYSGPDDPESNLNRESTFFETPAIAAYLASQATSFSFLEAAAAKSQCDWQLDYSRGFFMLQTHLSSTRQAARLLCVRARARAHAGDHRGAADDLKRVNTLAKHVSCDKLLLNALVAISIREIANATLQSIVLRDTPVQPRDVEAYREAARMDGDPRAEFIRTFESESIFQAELFDRMAMQDDKTSAELKAAGLNMPREAGFAFSLIYGYERKTQQAILNDIRTIARNGKLDFDEAALLQRNQKGPSFMVAMTLPAYSRVHVAFMRQYDNRLCADAALAVLLFRAKNVRDPKTLDELVPEFLPSAPVDWFKRNSLKLWVDPHAIELYRTAKSEMILPPGSLRIHTVGQDGVDDHGWGKQSIENHPEARAGDDEVFFLPLIRK